MSANTRLLPLLIAVVLSPIIGCGGADHPDLGTVTGTVTIDGKPMAGVNIAFMPEVGRPSTAVVDEQGRYELLYTEGLAGTKVGPNKVSFSWPTGVSGIAIPARYAEKSELKAEIKPGSNTFDYDLKSDPGSPTTPAPAYD